MEKQWKPVPDVECLKYHGTPGKPDIKIFVSHRIDLDSETIDNSIYIPVRCGAVFDEREGIMMLGDDTGENISERRLTFNELTVLYWAWKNVKADYYGLCHYRRYLSFAEKQDYRRCEWGGIGEDVIDENTINKYGLTDKDIRRKISLHPDIDVFLPQQFFLKSLHNKSYSQIDRYRDVVGKEFSETVIEQLFVLIKEDYPDYFDAAKTHFTSGTAYFSNCCVMKARVFNKYCNWVFDILFKLEKRIDFSNQSMTASRVMGYLGEDLFSIYIARNREINEIKIHELQLVFFENTARIDSSPAFSAGNIPIIFSCSEQYAAYVAGTVRSIIAHSSEEHNYDLIFLHTGITENSQRQLQVMVSEHTNFSIRFFNVERFIQPYQLTLNSHFTVETFYRLLLPQLLPNYDKVIYLDSDLMVLHDVAELFAIDIGDHLLAATIDADMTGEYNGAIPGVKDYCDTVLKLADPYSYFQAGVLVFNLSAFRKTFASNELLELAAKREYRYVDQDVLNVACGGRVHTLDMRWNVMTDCGGTRIGTIIQRAPLSIYQAYLKARKDPYIIHYAGWQKPWNNPQSDFAEVYWKYARQTPFYEVNLFRLAKSAEVDRIESADSRSKARQIADRILPKGTRRRNLAKKILPKGSRRWNFCKKIYKSMFKR